MFTFEERLNEGISGTDAKANGETAADIMKVVKEEVLLVSCFTWRNLHLWENDVEKIFYPFYGEKEEIAKLVRDVGRLFFNSVKVYFNWSLSLLWMKWCHPLGITWIGAFYSLAHMVLLSKHFVIIFSNPQKYDEDQKVVLEEYLMESMLCMLVPHTHSFTDEVCKPVSDARRWKVTWTL